MKPSLIRLLHLTAIVLLSNTIMSQDIHKTYPDGSPKSYTEYTSADKLSYKWIFYHTGSRIAAEGEVLEGIEIGSMRRAYSDQGNKLYEFEIQDGVNHGSFKTFHENGTIRIDGHFDHGQPDGQWSLWSKTGVRILRGEFAADGRFRVIEARDAFRHLIIRDGEGDLEYYTNDSYEDIGKVKVVVRYRDGFKDSLRTETDMNGLIRHQVNFKNGRYDGEMKSFYANKYKQWQYSFVNGIPSGTQMSWNENGMQVRYYEYPVLNTDTIPSYRNYRPFPKEDMLWHSKVSSRMPLKSNYPIPEIDPMLSHLLELLKDTCLHAYRTERMLHAYKDVQVGAKGIYDTLNFGGSVPVINHYRFDAANVNAFIVQEDWFYDKQTDRLHYTPAALGFQFGIGDTALYPVWIDLQELRNCQSQAMDSLIERIDQRSFSASLIKDDAGFDREMIFDPAEASFEAEQLWVELNTQWMDLLVRQLNLRGIDRKSP